jgi:SAM-dependent methyltransferase
MIKNLIKNILSEKTRLDIRFCINRLKAPIYFGSRFYCNCCGKSFRKLLTKGIIQRPNAECPYCGSLERTRLLHQFLENETTLFTSKLKVLHIAPERCLYDRFKKLDIEYYDGDLNPAFATHQVDVTAIKFPNNTFDLIICAHVLGHVPDEPKAIAELFRVLKPGGQALIMTLFNSGMATTLEDAGIATPEVRTKFYGEPDLCRLHGADFGKRLEAPGFMVEAIDYRHKLKPQILDKGQFGDGQREIIFKCTKRT